MSSGNQQATLLSRCWSTPPLWSKMLQRIPGGQGGGASFQICHFYPSQTLFFVSCSLLYYMTLSSTLQSANAMQWKTVHNFNISTFSNTKQYMYLHIRHVNESQWMWSHVTILVYQYEDGRNALISTKMGWVFSGMLIQECTEFATGKKTLTHGHTM